MIVSLDEKIRVIESTLFGEDQGDEDPEKSRQSVKK